MIQKKELKKLREKVGYKKDSEFILDCILCPSCGVGVKSSSIKNGKCNNCIDYEPVGFKPIKTIHKGKNFKEIKLPKNFGVVKDVECIFGKTKVDLGVGRRPEKLVRCESWGKCKIKTCGEINLHKQECICKNPCLNTDGIIGSKCRRYYVEK